MALIACVLVPQLAVAVARRDDRALADAPLVLYAQERQRATVVAASPDTGLAPGTPLRQAIVRCPGAVYRPAAPDHDQQALAALVRLLEAFSPRVAADPLMSDARIELDLGGSSIAHAIALTQRIASQIQANLRLMPALGVATTRFVARHAATVAGAGATVIVPAGLEANFLAPHPVTTLPIDDETTHRLHLLGLYTIGDLACLPLDALQAQFGGIGRTLYHLARGSGDALPIGRSPAPTALIRRGRFAGPLTNRTLLETAIERLAAPLTAQLATGGWAARAIALTLSLADGVPWTGERALRTPTADPRLLTQAFLALNRAAMLESGVEAVTLHITALVATVATQRDLFAPAAGRAEELDRALDRLRARYAGSFVRAQLNNLTAHLPEQRVRFDPWEPQ